MSANTNMRKQYKTNTKQRKTDPFSRRYSKITGAAKSANKHTDNQPSKRKHKPQEQIAVPKKPVKIYFLGGINEVGKNMTVFEYENDMIIVDCGLSFPDETMPGVDIVIPDFTFVEENYEKIKGIIITHGHEDHIGGLAFLLKKLRVPVYGTRLTIGLIEGKLKEHELDGKVELKNQNPGDIVQLGKFSVEFIHVNHSIPDAVGFAIRCEGGTIVHTGDFKIDPTPIDGGMIDLPRFGQLGNEGVLCLMADSTNSERPGFTESERKVGESFESLFRKAGNRRIIVATFASNIHRVQQIIDVAKQLGRKVALSGRSLENVVSISKELGYLNVPDNTLIALDEINQYSSDKLVLITTGSQGEPMSALTRMAFSDHRKVTITANDYIIISATPIPGNEKTVSRVVNKLLSLGAEVIYEKMYDVHVSGHACREELKIILGMVKPKYFIPVHGEKKHLIKHYQLAESVGISKSNIALADNGAAFELSESGIVRLPDVPTGEVMVDGIGVGDVGNVVMNDRKKLAQNGLVIVSFAYDTNVGQLVSYPEIETRGFIYKKEAEELIEEAKQVAYDTILSVQGRGKNYIRSVVRDDISKLMYERTGRNPLILPILIEVY